MLGDGARIDRRPIDGEAFTEVAKPAMILIELLTAGQRSPGNQLVHVGVAGRVADVLALDAGPGRRRDDLARLRLNIAEADLLVLARLGKMRMVASGCFPQRLPGLDRHLAVGLRRQIEDDFGGIDVGFDARAPLGRAAVVHPVVEITEALHLVLGVPAMPLPPLPSLSASGPSAVKRR